MAMQSKYLSISICLCSLYMCADSQRNANSIQTPAWELCIPPPRTQSVSIHGPEEKGTSPHTMGKLKNRLERGLPSHKLGAGDSPQSKERSPGYLPTPVTPAEGQVEHSPESDHHLPFLDLVSPPSTSVPVVKQRQRRTFSRGVGRSREHMKQGLPEQKCQLLTLSESFRAEKSEHHRCVSQTDLITAPADSEKNPVQQVSVHVAHVTVPKP